MDWFEVLLLFIFFGLPLLQRIFGKHAPPEERLPPVEDEYGEYGERRHDLPAPPREAAPAPAKSGGGGWSTEWGEWPGIETADEEEEQAVARIPDIAPEPIHTAEAVSLEPVTVREEVVRPLPAPLVKSLEVTELDRKAEHERFHRRIARPAAAPASPPRMTDQLRSREGVRRAVLMAEILGPPRSLRAPEER